MYFLGRDSETPAGVDRSIQADSPYAKQALEALLAGPTDLEKQQGLSSAIPSGASLGSLAITDSTSATVDISGLPSTDDGIRTAEIITQVVRSVVGVSGIEEVTFPSDGKPWGMPLMDGGVRDGPYGYSQLLGWTSICRTSDVGGQEGNDQCFHALP